ncbi:MAG TPA: beta-propeller fold lactonase family protein [Acidobacteriaceae bacterium]|jgi:6-phosphogluconolactonase (cycloisomerase 2 family)
MKLGFFGRMAMALVASLALGLGMTACGGGTIAYVWVVGSQYNQIAGFKVDDFSGNLTTIPRSPFSVNGANPVSILVRPGGRYVYVLNQGTGGGPTNAGGTPSFTKGSSSGISVFAVGGDGTLTYQVSYQSQGFVPMWAQFDGTGSYIYVLDKYSPYASAAACLASPTSATCFGAITAFSIDSTTGRLTLVTNSQTQVGGVNTFAFNVGVAPNMMKTAGGCLFTANTATNTITPYGLGSNGQLTTQTTQSIVTGASAISSINGSGSYIFLTDPVQNRIFPFNVGAANCNLNIFTGGSLLQNDGATQPANSLIDNSGKYLYVLNQGTTNPTSQSCCSISGYTLNTTTGTLTEITGSPYTVGSAPVCAVEDQTNQYIYVSSHNDGVLTGKVIDSTTGRLTNLTRGATFNATGQAGCLALSNNVQ